MSARETANTQRPRARILFSFVGNHDAATIPAAGDDPGPVLSLLGVRDFSHVVLFLTRSEYAERAEVIRSVMARRPAGPTFSFVDIMLNSVVDYEEIYGRLSEALARVMPMLPYPGGGAGGAENFVLLDPGTPQMQTVWFLMVQSGAFTATLLQGIPARFGDGVYRSREVHIDSLHFPVQMRYVAATPDTAGAGAGTGRTWTLISSDIVGQSTAMLELMHRVDLTAQYDEAVLVTGETGTGKELVARHIHEQSARCGRPFITVNAATLGGELAESALFGHRKGAYTGAAADRLGAFRSAHGGTLFLDEVGELPLGVQASLLRAIELGEVTPLGEDTPLYVDVRLIAATHRNLEQMVATGLFREDLYGRLRQLPLLVPPLRERGDDVLLLAHTFLESWNAERQQKRRFSHEAFAVLAEYRWPRNVRQLQSAIRQAAVFCSGEVLEAKDIRDTLDEVSGGGGASAAEPPAVPAATLPVQLETLLEETERQWYRTALRHSNGNRAEAARLLGINAPAFRKALRERFSDLVNDSS